MTSTGNFYLSDCARDGRVCLFGPPAVTTMGGGVLCVMALTIHTCWFHTVAGCPRYHRRNAGGGGGGGGAGPSCEDEDWILIVSMRILIVSGRVG